MAAPARNVVLVSHDPELAGALERHCPAGAALCPVGARELPDSTALDRDDLWIDLDAWPPKRPMPQASVVFYADDPAHRERLPAALLVRKPCSQDAAAAVWSIRAPTSAPASARDDQPVALPPWLQSIHVLDLRELCHALVTHLPPALGYREASLYLCDASRQVLTLAESSCNRPIDLAVRLSADASHVLALAARGGCVLVARDADEACRALGAGVRARQMDAEDGGCLLAALSAAGRVGGLLVCTARLSEGTRPPPWMPAVLSFAGRALSHARLHEQARIEARVDGLTGLYNYRWMTETLRRELQRAQRHDVPLALLMLDLDGLKQVNDRCGHRAGDAVLRHVAAVIRSALREADSAARCGGDEFVLLLPDTDAAGAMRVAERVVRGLREGRCGHGGQELPVAASVGVAQWRSGWTVEQWIEAADQAMYAAKRAKRHPDGADDNDAAPAIRAAPSDPGRAV